MHYHADMSSSPPTHSPTVRRRRLSRELITLREDLGLTPAQVADHFERDRNWLDRIESGVRKRPYVDEVASLLDHYGVTDDTDPQRREAILELVRQARTKGWWSQYGDVLDGYVGLEVEASSVSTYQPLVVPGLLQTPAYAAASARAAINAEADVARTVESRIERQKILDRERAPLVWAVIDEAVLARGSDSAVMHEQIAHLVQVSERRNVTIQLLPFSAGFHAGLSGPFVILDFPVPADPSVVYLESRHDSLYLEDPEVVAEYRTILGHIQTAALSPADSITHLKRLIS